MHKLSLSLALLACGMASASAQEKAAPKAIVPAAVKWLPFSGLTTALTQTGTVELFSRFVSGLLMALYLAIALAAGIAVTKTRDVE